MGSPSGRCYWAVAPFSPQPPFRLYARDAPPVTVQSAGSIVDAARKGMSEFVMLSTVKARPVLVLTDVLPEYDEVLALRLRRFAKLGSDYARDRVRRGDDANLFALERQRFSGLPEENAAIVSSLMRLPIATLDRRETLGHVDEHGLRLLHERVVTALRLRVDTLVLDRATRLVERARGRSD